MQDAALNCSIAHGRGRSEANHNGIRFTPVFHAPVEFFGVIEHEQIGLVNDDDSSPPPVSVLLGYHHGLIFDGEDAIVGSIGHCHLLGVQVRQVVLGKLRMSNH